MSKSDRDTDRSGKFPPESRRDALISFGCSLAIALAIAAILLVYLTFG